MHFSLDISGTAAEVRVALANAVRSARVEHPDHAAPAIQAVQDYVAQEIARLDPGPDDQLLVQGSVSLAITRSAVHVNGVPVIGAAAETEAESHDESHDETAQ